MKWTSEVAASRRVQMRSFEEDWAASCTSRVRWSMRGPSWALSKSSCLVTRVTRSRLCLRALRSFFVTSQQLLNSRHKDCAAKLYPSQLSLRVDAQASASHEGGSRSEVPLEKLTRTRPGGSRWRQSWKIGPRAQTSPLREKTCQCLRLELWVVVHVLSGTEQ